MDDEWNVPSKLDYYLAQICLHLYNLRFILGGKPDKKLDDFLLEFKTKRVGDELEVEVEEEVDENGMTQSQLEFKHSLMAALGLNKDGTPTGAPLKTRLPPIPKERNNPIITKPKKV